MLKNGLKPKFRIIHTMQVFMASDAKVMKIPLYMKEIKEVEMRYPEDVKITKCKKILGSSRYICLIEKKSK